MKALAYRNYVPGVLSSLDGYVCVHCVEKDQLNHEYSTLFFCYVRLGKVDEEIRCAWCGSKVGDTKNSHAAKRIASMIEGGPQEEEEE